MRLDRIRPASFIVWPVAETLTIDCGGGGIKASVLNADGAMLAEPIRVPTPYPLSTSLFIETLLALAKRLPPATRVTAVATRRPRTS